MPQFYLTKGLFPRSLRLARSVLEVDLRQLRIYHPPPHTLPPTPIGSFLFDHRCDSCPSSLFKMPLMHFNIFIMKNLNIYKGEKNSILNSICHHPGSTIIKSFAEVAPCLPQLSLLKYFRANPRFQPYHLSYFHTYL